MLFSLLTGIVVMMGLFIYSFMAEDFMTSQLCLALSVFTGANNFRIISKNNAPNVNEL